MWNNLGCAAEKAAARLRPGWLPPEREPAPAPEVLPEKAEGLLTRRNRERHALMDRGVNLAGTMRELRLDPKTVRKFMRAVTADELLVHGPSGRCGVLDEYAEYLARRWDEGCTGAHILHAELTARGVRVSARTVRCVVHRMREHGAPAPRSLAPKPREVAKLILTHPDALSEQDRILLKELTSRCSDLATVRTLAHEFAEITRPPARARTDSTRGSPPPRTAPSRS